MGLTQQPGDDGELMRLVESYFQSSDSALLLAFRVSKSQASSWTVSGRRSRLTTKARILSVTAKRSSVTQKFKVKLQVLKQTASGEVQTAKVYKLKHLSKVEAVPTDNSGCTFILGFDNLKAQAVAPPQWTMRNLDDRNRLVTCLLKLCKENLGRVPKIVGMDIVEMTLWAKANAKSLPIDGPASPVAEGGRDASRGVDVVERELVSKAEEDDMEALLDSYVLGIDEAEAFSERLKRELTALEAANVHAILESQPLVEEVLHQLDGATISVEDMDEWLDIFNVKLRHMREDIESIESRNNRLDMQSQNNAALGEELSKLLERLRVPSEYATLLTSGSFEESSMPENVEACEWLVGALRGLEPPLLDPAYLSVRAVTDKRAELEKLKTTFVRRASDFLRNYFASVVDFMISDKSYSLQKGQLKRPDHADLRYKCRSYARMLQHIKTLDSNALIPLRKHYCSSLNQLLRKEAHEFASELKTQVKGLPKASGAWMEGSNSSSSLNSADTTIVSDAYSRMLRIFIPLLVDESRFFASFMCFDVVPTGHVGANGAGGGNEDEDDISPLDEDGSDLKPADPNPAELEALNQALQELLAGVEVDFNVVVDWAWKTDPLRCISMHGITEKYLAIHEADAASFVRQLLTALQDRISQLFSKFVETVNNQFEKHEKTVKQAGVLSYIPRFSLLAQKMESLIMGNSREIVDSAYKKLVETMFAVLERIAQVDPKHADIILLENYAAFQNYMFDLANMVQILGNYYQQASECYEQACTRYVNTVINYQFERLFQFGQKVENLLYTITPEEVPFQINFSRADLRKLLSGSLKGVEKSLREMNRRMQKHLISSDELLPSLWEKCKEDFLEKYEALEALLMKCYPSETLSPSSEEMKELFKSVG